MLFRQLHRLVNPRSCRKQSSLIIMVPDAIKNARIVSVEDAIFSNFFAIQKRLYMLLILKFSRALIANLYV